MTSFDRHWKESTRDDLLATIKKTERARILSPFVLMWLYGIFYWINADEISENLASFAFLFVLISIGIVIEILSCKVLLFKAELREVMRTLGEYPIPAE